MKVHHVKHIWSRPFLMNWRKPFCPLCGEKLQKIKISKIVHSQSEEAKDYDFSSPGGDGYMIGNVKFIWTEFYCDKCDKNFSINSIYQTEKEANKAGQE